MKPFIKFLTLALMLATTLPAQQPPAVPCDTYDISNLQHGTVINNLFAADGMTIQVVPGPGGTTDAVIYDSDGNWPEDPDLNAGIGNLIIINEDPNLSDGDNGGPDDNAHGGTLIFTFASPVNLTSFVVVDADHNQSYAVAYDAGNNVIVNVPIPLGPDGNVQTVPMNALGCARLEIVYANSGGFQLNIDCPPPPCDTYDISNLQHGTVINNLFAADGMTIQVVPGPGGTTDAVIYDSDGNWPEDPDLNAGIGNLIIINEDPNLSDGDNGGPDDNAHGGTLIFTFASPVNLTSFVVVDADHNQSYAVAYDAGNNVIVNVPIPLGPDGNVQTVPMNALGCARLEIVYANSGGFQLNIDCGQQFNKKVTTPIVEHAAEAKLEVNAYPNPFRDKLNVDFRIPSNGYVIAEIISLDGKTVRSLFDGAALGGSTYPLHIQSKDLPNGLYFFRVRTSEGLYKMIPITSN